MATHPCDYCGENTSAKPFWSGKLCVLLPQGRADIFESEKILYLRACKSCTKERALEKVGFTKGLKGTRGYRYVRR